MAKGGDLWDDSALLNAFDHAMTKYKRMHIDGYKENSADVKEAKNDIGDVSAASTSVYIQEAKSDMEGDDNSTLAKRVVEEAYGNGNVILQGPRGVAEASNGNPAHEVFQNCSNSQVLEDYNELYKQYYVLEEQRQNILQKLQQFGDWNHSYTGDCAGSGMQWGPQSYSCQDCDQNILVSCCSCVCQCSVAPSSSVPRGSVAGACGGALSTDPTDALGGGKHLASEDADVVNTAMRAAESAISSLKKQASDHKEENNENGVLAVNTTSETDLSVVLSAWYSAGFHTGKYLTEQSLAKKRHC